MIRAAVVAVLLSGVGFALYYWRAEIAERTKGWRTVIWNGFVVGVVPILMVAIEQAQTLDWKEYLTPVNVAFATVAIKSVDMWLRYITTGPVGSKGEQEPTPAVKAGD